MIIITATVMNCAASSLDRINLWPLNRILHCVGAVQQAFVAIGRWAWRSVKCSEPLSMDSEGDWLAAWPAVASQPWTVVAVSVSHASWRRSGEKIINYLLNIRSNQHNITIHCVHVGLYYFWRINDDDDDDDNRTSRRTNSIHKLCRISADCRPEQTIGRLFMNQWVK